MGKALYIDSSRITMPEQAFFLSGPTGPLEAILSLPEDSESHSMPFKGVALILHPHPLYGGSFNNKVVTTLARAYRELGIPNLRFNFRGVGKSAGTYNDGVGEYADAVSALTYLKNHFPDTAYFVSGFSFGAYIAWKLAQHFAEISHLTLVAPAVTRFEFTLSDLTCPLLLIQGEQDEIISSEAVLNWYETVQGDKTLIRFPLATHFFHGLLTLLRESFQEKMKLFLKENK